MLFTLVLLLVVFGHNMRPEVTYVAVFAGLVALYFGAVPVWVLTLASLALWAVVEVCIAQLQGMAARRVALGWRIGQISFIAMVA